MTRSGWASAALKRRFALPRQAKAKLDSFGEDTLCEWPSTLYHEFSRIMRILEIDENR